jgi:hypothetical protein
VVSYYLLGTQAIHGHDIMDVDVGFIHLDGSTTIKKSIEDWSGVSQRVHKRDFHLAAVIEVVKRLPLWEDPSYSIYVYRDEIPLE